VWKSFRHKQVGAAIGVIAGTGFNFVGSRSFVFRARHMAPKQAPGDELRD
jgi:putative flippase GtrA